MRLFVDNLTNIDFSYLCPIRGLVGETWLAHIELTGNLDADGMVCDFGIVKKQLRHWLDTHLDHCLLVPTNNSHVFFSSDETRTEVSLNGPNGETLVWTRAPKQAITLMDIDDINRESVATWCLQHLSGLFGKEVEQIKLSFDHEHIVEPFYHYSHGLKKHGGHCQRITHGHRSKILIWRNEVLCPKTMIDWSLGWQDIYIASRDDLIEDSDGLYGFQYMANQGLFELKLEKNRCYFIGTDTTVEHIAAHIHQVLSAQYPNEDIRVKAFEGIGKGAIVG